MRALAGLAGFLTITLSVIYPPFAMLLVIAALAWIWLA